MARNTHKQFNEVSRRDFMWKSGCASLGVVSMASTIWDLRFINAAVASNAVGSITDYKALVCVFLFGGNDANNLLIPTDTTTYNTYVAKRGGTYNPGSSTNTTLAIPVAGTTSTSGANIGVLPLNGAAANGQTFGLHPAAIELAALYNSGQCAFLANVGTLVYPFPYGADSYFGHNGKAKVPSPPQLFSHNDQQIQWQTSVPDRQSPTGWGGRCADMVNAAANGSAACSMNISLGGQNTFETGTFVAGYNISTNGAPAPTGSLGSGAASQLQALNDLIGYRTTDAGYSSTYDISSLHPNLYEQSFATTTRNGIALAGVVTVATGGISNADPIFTAYNAPVASGGYGGSNSLSGFAQQLRMVAKMIKGRTALQQQRQIFFVQMGGYDLHSGQGGPIGSHANLIRDLSRGLGGFYDATVRMGVATNVTAFTVSDFSRTFPINGGFGSDHGWGNHQLVVGGAVQGGKVYGQFPDLIVNGSLDTGTGRWTPTTAADEYFACLARWYGVSSTDIAGTVLPNIGRFANNLNFV
jgi:uncharacterized protein (DUF1501 family)